MNNVMYNKTYKSTNNTKYLSEVTKYIENSNKSVKLHDDIL